MFDNRPGSGYDKKALSETDFLSRLGNIYYYDDNIALISSLKELKGERQERMDGVLLIYCRSGNATFELDGEVLDFQQGDVLIYTQMCHIGHFRYSEDFDAAIVGLSAYAIQQGATWSPDTWHVLLYVKHTPIFHLTPVEMELHRHYIDLIALKLTQRDSVCFHETMHSLYCTMFYEFAALVKQRMADAPHGADRNMSRSDLLFRSFLELLMEFGGKERSVTAFAQRLHVTPKYLSTVVKAVSGQTALEWIHEYTAVVVSQSLRKSDKSIKEVAFMLNFPNLSFFGKFCKTHLGLSPKEFRRQMNTPGKRTAKGCAGR